LYVEAEHDRMDGGVRGRESGVYPVGCCSNCTAESRAAPWPRFGVFFFFVVVATNLHSASEEAAVHAPLFLIFIRVHIASRAAQIPVAHVT
jgi:hypothetical protein